MSELNKQLARDYLDAVTNGELPDFLLSDDMTAWTTMGGETDKAHYQHMVRVLAAVCAQPIKFTINALTAEDDRVVIEATSQATLTSGESYSNTYVFVLRVLEGRISAIAEHFNPIIVAEKLLPVMAAVKL